MTLTNKEIAYYYNDQKLYIKNIELNYIGKMETAFLAKPVDIQIGKNTLPLREGSRVYFNRAGNINFESTFCMIFLSKDSLLKVGKNKVTAIKNRLIRVYNNGSVESLCIRDTILLTVGNIDIHFKKNSNSYSGDLFFHKNGQLYMGYLANDTTLEFNGREVIFFKDSLIRFNQYGSVISGKTNQMYTIGTGKYEIPIDPESNSIEFSRSGQLLCCDIARNLKLIVGTKEVEFAAQAAPDGLELRDLDPRDGSLHFYDLYFYSDGTIKGGALAKDTEFKAGGVVITALSKVESDYSWRPYEFAQVIFHRNGNLKQCKLGMDTKFNKNNKVINVKKGCTVTFKKNGTLVKINNEYV